MEFNLEGPNIYMRLVTVDDAEFICSLRDNKKFNTHLSKSSPIVEDQRQWILDYKQRELRNEEYYFIIHRKSDGLRIGTTRLYDFREDPKSYCWGSWILNEDKTRYAAVESSLMMYEAAFNKLGFEQSHYDVRKGNHKVYEFHERMGAQRVEEDDLNYYYIFPKQNHIKNRIEYADFMV